MCRQGAAAPSRTALVPRVRCARPTCRPGPGLHLEPDGPLPVCLRPPRAQGPDHFEVRPWRAQRFRRARRTGCASPAPVPRAAGLQRLPMSVLFFKELAQGCNQGLLHHSRKELPACRAQDPDSALRRKRVQNIAHAPFAHSAVDSQLGDAQRSAMAQQGAQHAYVPSTGQQLGQRQSQVALDGRGLHEETNSAADL
jgi:hypothetical protein